MADKPANPSKPTMIRINSANMDRIEKLASPLALDNLSLNGIGNDLIARGLTEWEKAKRKAK